jgi:hypothetical protein
LPISFCEEICNCTSSYKNKSRRYAEPFFCWTIYKASIITSVRPMSKATLNQSSKPLIHRIRKSAKTRIGRQFAGACTSPIEIFAAKGGFSPWAAIPPAVPGTYRRSGGSALLIAFHVARTNSSREANCLGSMGGWKTSVAVPPFISDVPLGIIS